MNNMANMRNCPEGCMVDQIRSRGNCNFYLPLFSLIRGLSQKVVDFLNSKKN